MPAQTTLSTEDKSKVKSAINDAQNKIKYACLGRVYYAYPDPNDWSYAGLQGAIALVLDTSKCAYYFRLVDLSGTRGVIWEHELYEGFEYNQDRLFFHSFPGDVSAELSRKGELPAYHPVI